MASKLEVSAGNHC